MSVLTHGIEAASRLGLVVSVRPAARSGAPDAARWSSSSASRKSWTSGAGWLARLIVQAPVLDARFEDGPVRELVAEPRAVRRCHELLAACVVSALVNSATAPERPAGRARRIAAASSPSIPEWSARSASRSRRYASERALPTSANAPAASVLRRPCRPATRGATRRALGSRRPRPARLRFRRAA